MLRKLLIFLTSAVTLWLLLGVLCQQVPPHAFWPAGFIAYSLPGALLLNAVLVLLWLWRKPLYAVWPIGLMILFWGQYSRFFSLRSPDVQPAATAQHIHVLSYNVRVFNVYKHLHEQDPELPEQEMEWVANHPADILCLQEYYQDKKDKAFNSGKRIGKAKGREFFIGQALVNDIGAEFGQAIFSRYPILDKGSIRFDTPTKNQAIYVDVLLPNADTLRVYNIHLQSMAIEEKDVAEAVESENGLKTKGRNIARRLKLGFIARSQQVQRLLEHMADCKHPILVCGDLNDIPSSYTYQQLKEQFNNAFEEDGDGFGFTYNGKLPLRIDNQFHSPALQLLRFEVRRDILFSDHFPLEATYVLESDRP